MPILPETSKLVAFTTPRVEMPLIDKAVPTILDANTDPPVNSP